MAKQPEKNKKVKRPTALKRDLQSEKRRLRNRSYRAKVNTAIRHFEESLSKGDKNATNETLSSVYSLMDKGVKKGIFKQNKSNRTKARLTARLVA